MHYMIIKNRILQFNQFQMKKILAIIGARPQFIKHAPIEIAFRGHFDLRALHTGQHYDHNMSTVFFDEFGLNKPHYQLAVGSSGHGIQTGQMMAEIEPICEEFEPDYVMVYGDTNSTLAGALVASKLGIKVIHVEAGLRSFNREMPEEINRVLTDHISDILIVPKEEAINNLQNEGIINNVYLTGDIMKDMVFLARKRMKDNFKGENYYYATIHRPYNTDTKGRLLSVLDALNGLTHRVLFPMHPRTKNFAIKEGIDIKQFDNIEVTDPKGYFDNIEALAGSQGLITDSGGMQKEAYILKKKCVTIRTETEWVETTSTGWNTLLFHDLSDLQKSLSSESGAHDPELYGSGNAAKEILNHILDFN